MKNTIYYKCSISLQTFIETCRTLSAADLYRKICQCKSKLISNINMSVQIKNSLAEDSVFKTRAQVFS